jgi:SAM-dependent methyltransferase
VSDAGPEADLDALLGEQQAYYRARAPTYLDGALQDDDAGQLEAELARAFDARCRGDVLELACGPGTWTGMLAEQARSVTAVDGAPEMLELARLATPAEKVRFVAADLFTWRPDRRYDAVFFGFWLSHVPDERWDGFWALVADCLAPGGWAVFTDDAYRTADELVYGEASSVIQRRLGDGSRHRIIKAVRTAPEVEARLRAEGWDMSVRQIGEFFWGAGRHQRSPS